MNLAKHLRNVAKDANEVSFRKYRTAMYEKLKKRASEGYRHMSVKVDSDFFTAKQLDRLQNGLESQGFKITVSRNTYVDKVFIEW
ncbi:hypothetical protein [Bacillus thuringiensis]|uniref:hypothetical protein n=1 Tax=Bacillus thuringiensis TaxID=1428 RepID=UPI003F5BFE32